MEDPEAGGMVRVRGEEEREGWLKWELGEEEREDDMVALFFFFFVEFISFLYRYSYSHFD